MKERTVVILALGITAATLALTAAGWLFAYWNHDLNLLTSQYGPDLVLQIGILPVGFIVAIKQPRNPLGWLFLVCAMIGALDAAAGEYAVHGLTSTPRAPGTVWAAWLSNWAILPVFPAGGFLFVVLLFPTGHLVSPRWRILGWTSIVLTTVMIAGAIATDYPLSVAPGLPALPNPTGIHGYSRSFLGYFWVLWPGTIVLLLVAAVSVIVRYRRSSGDERHQIKWFTYAVALTLAAYAAGTPFSVANQGTAPFLNAVTEIGIGIGIPVACGIAILKYRLYGIDAVISRTLVYGSLAALITAVYVGIAVGLGELVGSGGKPNLGLSILATAIVAVSFQPVRVRVQHVANRLVYGRRATPYEVLSEFSGRVAETYAAEDVLPRMAQVLRDGTGAASATVWLRAGSDLRPAATAPASANGQRPLSVRDRLPAIPDADAAVPVMHRGELLGALAVVKRRGEQLTPIERKLVEDLALQAGLVLKNVGLTAELLQRLDDLRESRQRLVSAQDEERRRLERNLHDGAQQHLVALKVKLGLAEKLVAKSPEQARRTIEQLKSDTDEALETLRDLARGIYPPLLADQGLVAALRAQARKATLPVSVEAESVSRYPQAQEAAVYFSVLEALQNVQKYAGATCATVSLRDDGGELSFQVCDDGRGFDPATVRRGSGLTNVADRLDALGGKLILDAAPGQGCRVAGALPVPQPVG